MKQVKLGGKVRAAVLLLVLAVPLFGFEHPRNMITMAHCEAIYAKYQAGQEPWKIAVGRMLADANSLLTRGFSSITDNGAVSGDPRYFSTTRGYPPPGVTKDVKDIAILADAGARAIALGAAYCMTKDAKYAKRGIDFINYFCLDPKKGMIPSGKPTGGGGIVHILMSVHYLYQGMDFLMAYPGFTTTDKTNWQSWTRKQIMINLNNVNGTVFSNNWEDWRLAHLAQAACVLEDATLMSNNVVKRWTQLLPTHIRDDGIMANDFKRDQGMAYSCMALAAYGTAAWVAYNWGHDLPHMSNSRLKKAYDKQAYFLVDWPKKIAEFEAIKGKDEIDKVSKDHYGMFEMAYSFYQNSLYVKTILKHGRPAVDYRGVGYPTALYSELFRLGVTDPVDPPVDPVNITLEAEKMTLSNGYMVDTGAKLNGTAIVIDPNQPVPTTGIATQKFSGASGIYSVTLTAIPENDGQPTIKLYVAGKQVISEQLPMSPDYFTMAHRLDYTTSGVTINSGDEIKIEGTSHSVTAFAGARVDKITFAMTQTPVDRWQLTVDNRQFPALSNPFTGQEFSMWSSEMVNQGIRYNVYNPLGELVQGSAPNGPGMYIITITNNGQDHTYQAIKTR